VVRSYEAHAKRLRLLACDFQRPGVEGTPLLCNKGRHFSRIDLVAFGYVKASQRFRDVDTVTD
jgi:hypothetical protein